MTYRVSIDFFSNSRTPFKKTIDYILDAENEVEACDTAKSRLSNQIPTALIRAVRCEDAKNDSDA